MRRCNKVFQNHKGLICVSSVFVFLLTIIGGMYFTYYKGYFDAVDEIVGADECKPLRKLVKRKDFK